jgi:hypothetical protein
MSRPILTAIVVLTASFCGSLFCFLRILEQCVL